MKDRSLVELLVAYDPDRRPTLLQRFVAFFKKPRTLSRGERQLLAERLRKLQVDIKAMPRPELGPHGTVLPLKMFGLVIVGAKIEKILASPR